MTHDPNTVNILLAVTVIITIALTQKHIKPTWNDDSNESLPGLVM